MTARTENGVPEETGRVAKAAFPKGNAYILLRDELDILYQDTEFRGLYPTRGQPAESPGRLALVTILQFAEGLSDRQAADAVRSRIDWKYILGLELTDPGFDASVLSEFRSRIIEGGIEQQLLEWLLERLKEKGVIKSRGRQRTDSTHVQAAIRQLNRLERVGETMRAALNRLAELAPEWVQLRVPREWYQRYGDRFESYRLPKQEAEQLALALQIGRDGYRLLGWVWEAEAPPQLKTDASVRTLWRVWVQEYYREEDDLHWRTPDNQPPSERQIISPYDPEARFSVKRDMKWEGYKAHFTEICDDDQPHIITHVETTPATQPDNQITGKIHQALADKHLLPQEHLVDTGYVEAKWLVESQEKYHVELIGPAMPDVSWQAREGQGFDLSAFTIDWDARHVTCPQHQVSTVWFPVQDQRGNRYIQVEFRKSICHACSVRERCTHAQASGRKMRFRPKTEHEALQLLRHNQDTLTFKQRYHKRAGVEGTLSQGVRSFNLRRCRYIGLAKARLQNILIAVSINLFRYSAWLQNWALASTRTSTFSALAPSQP